MATNSKFDKTLSFTDSMGARARSTSLVGQTRSFIRLLWLFSKSDISTFVVPDTMFGILGSLSGPLLTTNPGPNATTVLSRMPAVAFFVWFNVLVFEFANQRAPESVVEDSYNKPWRPIPNGLITEAGTRRLLLAALPLFLAISYAMGVWPETALLYALTWMYNDLKGGDEDFVIRNIIIGAAFGVYNEGALKIAATGIVTPWGSSSGEKGEAVVHGLVNASFVWTAIISAVIFSTMQVQDLQDQVGDALKGRRSAPLVLGDGTARWTVAVPIIFWSVLCTLYWDIPVVWWILPITVGSIVAVRVLSLREAEQDHTTWVMWAAWLCCLYVLPVIKNPSAITDIFVIWG